MNPTDQFKTQTSGASSDQAPSANEADRAERDKSQGKSGMRPYLFDRKKKITQQLNATAKALRQSSPEMPNDSTAGLIGMSADTLDRVGSYLGERDMDQLIEEAQDYARKRPWWFIGGAFVIGMAATRFFKSSGPGLSGRRQPSGEAPPRRTETGTARTPAGTPLRPTTTV
ncbi:MAG: hypothetical protein WBY88_18295 [Desulfosarcina sp.]